MQKVVIVKIKNVNGALVIDPDTAELEKSKFDQLEWEPEDDSINYTIDFTTDNNCPFDWVDPKKKTKGKFKSGRIKFNANTNEYYKYSVEYDGLTVDPEVSIKP